MKVLQDGDAPFPEAQQPDGYAVSAFILLDRAYEYWRTGLGALADPVPPLNHFVTRERVRGSENPLENPLGLADNVWREKPSP
jgi:hypothetical protein